MAKYKAYYYSAVRGARLGTVSSYPSRDASNSYKKSCNIAYQRSTSSLHNTFDLNCFLFSFRKSASQSFRVS